MTKVYRTETFDNSEFWSSSTNTYFSGMHPIYTCCLNSIVYFQNGI